MRGRQVERLIGGLIWRAWVGISFHAFGVGGQVSFDRVDGLTASLRLGPAYVGVGVE